MRRYLPALLFVPATLGPFSFALTGCDMLKAKGEADAAASDAAAPVVVGPGTTTDTPPPTVAPTVAPAIPTVAPTVAPTGPVTARPAGADAGAAAVADAGAVKTDAGVVPVPTLNIPHLLDAGNPFKGFDAGGLKLPTFPK